MGQFNFWCLHFTKAGIWVVLTLSLNLINGFCGLFSLGHQGFWAAGAYAAAATVAFMPHGDSANWLSFFLSFPAAFLVAALFGLLVGVPCLRLKGDYLAIATLGFSEILRNVIQNSETLGKSLGMDITGMDAVSVSFSKVPRNIIYLLLAWLAAAGVALLLRNLIRSQHGRAIQAIRDDERAAELLGVNLTFYKVFVFVLGAGVAGFAGALWANYNGQVTINDFSFNIGVQMVVMVVLGGMGSIGGTVVATVVLYFIPELLRLWLPSIKVPVFYEAARGGWQYSDLRELWQVLFSLMLIVVVLVRPQGMLSGFDFFKKRAKKSA